MAETKKTKTKAKSITTGGKTMSKPKKAAVLKKWQTKEGLTELYSKKKMTAGKIAEKFGVKRFNILYYLHKFNIPIWSKTAGTKKAAPKKAAPKKAAAKGTAKKAPRPAAKKSTAKAKKARKN